VAELMSADENVGECSGRLEFDLRGCSGQAPVGSLTSFAVDRVASNLQISDDNLTVTQPGGGYHTFVLKPEMTDGQHELTVKLEGLHGNGWILLGVVAAGQVEEFLTCPIPYQAAYFSGYCTNGHHNDNGTWEAANPGLNVQSTGTLELVIDCDAKTLSIKHVESNTTVTHNNIPVPCFVAGCLHTKGNSLTILN
jgi:hypothetical protein